MLEKINIRLVLASIRPGDEYHWTGQTGDAGYQSLTDCLKHNKRGEMVWPNKSAPPTEAEIIAAWPAVQAEHSPEAIAQRQAEQDADAKLVKSIVLALKQQFPTLDLPQFRRDFISTHKENQ